ncbi:uncharacterized protein LOC143850868 [Tasmannia lanceolata]|uniref:uncharacterized protein LOC143850868 n=1 Tax=Tasmannia lanceolata TaxID=3420 RepID=UPI0040642B50
MGNNFIILLLQSLLFLILLTFSTLGSGATQTTSVAPAIEFRPDESIRYRIMPDVSRGRRKLAPFQLCLLCRCCAISMPSNCTTMPCCFGIDCQLPDKPFGVCAFVPKSCSCTSCSV